MPKQKQTPATPLTETLSPDIPVPIEISNIVESPFEPQTLRRAKFKDEDLESLGASIVKHRLRQPILVRPLKKGKHEIVFGERRYLAVKRKGLKTINCFVEKLTDTEVLELQYEENHKRLKTDALEDAFFFKFLIETEGYTSETIADRFDLNAQEVRRFLKLNNLIREAKEELSAGDLPLKHAVYLSSFPQESQREIVRRQLAYKYHDRTEKPTSFEDFKAQCEENIIRRLADAPFDTYDTRLHWSGLACADCPERTGFPGQLFPELKENDSCLNKYCFDWKDRANLKLRRAAIAVQMPNPERKPIEEIEAKVPLVTARDWTDEKVPFAEKVLTSQKLLPEPECEFSEISLVVEGERKGKETFICREKTCLVHSQKVAAEENALKKKEDDFERKVAALAREKVFAKAIEVFDDYKPVWMFDDLIQKLLVSLWYSCDWEKIKTILHVIKDWKNTPTSNDYSEVTQFFASLDRRRQSQMIFLFIHRTVSTDDDIKRIAADYARRDYRLFDAEARFELAPEEFKQSAAEYLAKAANGIEAEKPAFWWGFEQEAASAAHVVVE